MIEKTWLVILANFIPTVEQVGGIALGLSLGLDPMYTLLLSLFVNSVLFFPVFLVLEAFYDSFFSKIRIFRNFLERIREKGKPYVDKYGVLGITVLMVLPTPLSGTYTGTALSWFLGLDWKKSFLAIFLGSFIGGLVVLAAYYGVFGILKLFLGV